MAEEEKKDEELSQEELAKQWEEALAKQEGSQEQAEQEKREEEKREEESKTQVAEVKKPSEKDLSKLLERIMDIPLNVEVVVGETVIQIKELLNFGPGSVIELDRDTTEPVDIKVNGKLIAKGELVVVGEKFGVRITEIYAEERKSIFRDTLEGSLKK
jgi:flagellar motor switch protein FliN/FliY